MRNKLKYSIAMDPKVMAMAEAAAKKGGWSVSSYVEGAVLWDLISDGNTDAMKIAAGRILERVKEKFERVVGGEVLKA